MFVHSFHEGYVIHTTGTEWTFWEYLFTTKPGIGWIYPGLGYITGDVLIVVLLIIVVCSLSAVRASGYFQVRRALNQFYQIYQSDEQNHKWIHIFKEKGSKMKCCLKLRLLHKFDLWDVLVSSRCSIGRTSCIGFSLSFLFYTGQSSGVSSWFLVCYSLLESYCRS